MSADAIPDEERRKRPLWLAGLIGTAVPYLIGSLALAGWAARADPGGTSVAGLIDQLGMSSLLGAWLAVPPAAAMLMLLPVIGEPRKASALWVWLLTAAVATMPVTLITWFLPHLGDCFNDCPSESSFLVAPLIVEGFGLLGGAIGWFVRYGGRRA